MNKVWLIVEREFMTRVRKKSFILLTVLMPFLMVAVVTVPALLANMDSDEHFTVGIIDKTGLYAKEFKSEGSMEYVQVHDDRPIATVTDELKNGGSLLTQILYIPDTLTNAKDGAAVIYSVEETPHEVENAVNSVLRDKIRHDRLASYNIPNVEEIISASNVGFSVKTMRKTDDGDKESSAMISAVIGMVLSLLIYMFILSYGSMVMQSVMEEKANRIVEIIVSSVKPWQLMAGKIIGIGFVGIVQMLLWGGMMVCISAIAGTFYATSSPEIANISQMATTATAEQMAQLQTVAGNPVQEFMKLASSIDFTGIFVTFLFFFIGGYLLYASMFCAFGSAVNEMQDSAQFTMPVILIFVFALYAAMFSIENPNGPLAVWCSYIPLTSPIVMMVRMPFDVPVWSVVLSLVILYISAAAIILLSAKIYRTGILMYGQKPSFKDLAKWLRY
ncbi:MAG: ABC transporter permease [Bacteroidaceae bacterium]|nr:ABC transporter permease [Bacteroidaceae bacterium]